MCVKERGGGRERMKLVGQQVIMILLLLLMHSWVFTACVVMPSFYVGTEDLNPGPYVYTASTITH